MYADELVESMINVARYYCEKCKAIGRGVPSLLGFQIPFDLVEKCQRHNVTINFFI